MAPARAGAEETGGPPERLSTVGTGSVVALGCTLLTILAIGVGIAIFYLVVR